MVAAPAIDAAATPTVDPAHDRMSYGRKLRLLADAGHWPAMERLIRDYGRESDQVTAFIEARLPVGACAWCGASYFAYTKKLKYCTDKCRRLAAHAKEAGATPAPAAPAKGALSAPGELCLRLVRCGVEGKTTRFYTLVVVQDLFGGVYLNRQWGRERLGEGQRRSDRYASLDEAVRQFAAIKELAFKRGYREEIG